MIQLALMKVYPAGILIALMLVAMGILMPWAMFAQDAVEPEDSSTVPVDKAITDYGFNTNDVESVISGLTSGDQYKYDEATLDDPPWLLSLKEWWRNFRQRLASGPLNRTDFSGMTTLSYVIISAVILLVVAVFMFRMFERRYGVIGGGAAAEAVGEFGIAGSWGETGVAKATELAAAGMFRDAISVLFKSALRGLNNTGWINYRTSAGSRIYLRQLRKSAEIYPIFRDFLARFEVAFYRKDNADDDDWGYMYETYGTLARTATSNPSRVQTRIH